jgi:hypothetical protein
MHKNRKTFVVLIIMLLASLMSSVYVVSASGAFVEIVKTGPANATAGESIVFTLTIKTYASGVVTEGIVWDDLQYATVDRYEIFRRDLTSDELDTLNAGGAVTIDVPYRVPCDAGNHVLDNDAWVEVTFTDGTTSRATNDHDVPVAVPSDGVDCTPAIDLEKYVNGYDADTPAEAVMVDVGDLLKFDYVVTNTGDAALFNGEVVDDNETPGDPADDFVVGTFDSLAPGQSVTFTRYALAEAGHHTNVGEVCATSSSSSGSQYLCDDDPANYKTPEEMRPGTGTPGYWMNHPEAWPVDEITIGGVTYTKDEAIGYMMDPVKRDKTFTMFPALVAAKLNVLIGNDDSCIADIITAADAWMADNPLGSKVRGNSDAWKEGEPLYWALDEYNNGDASCVVSRDDLED